jgi:hypothetical protein
MKNFFKHTYNSTIKIALNEIIRILDKPFTHTNVIEGPCLAAREVAAEFNELSDMIIKEVSRNTYIFDRTIIIRAAISHGTYNIHDLEFEPDFVRLLINEPVILNRLISSQPLRRIGPDTPDQILPSLVAPSSSNTRTQSDQHIKQEEKDLSELSFDFEQATQILGNNLEESVKLTQRLLENLG